MTDLPHVIAGQTGVSEEHIRVVEAWWREHNDGPMPQRWTASMYNRAVDWWNAGVPDEEAFPRMLTPEEMSNALDRLFSDTELKSLKVPVELIRRLPTPVPTFAYPIELPGGAELLAWIEPADDEKGGEP